MNRRTLAALAVLGGCVGACQAAVTVSGQVRNAGAIEV